MARERIIAIASDHAGFDLKKEVLNKLSGADQFNMKDLGTYDTVSVDYPIFAHTVALGVSKGKYDTGILICGTGIGMSMAANRYKEIRAAVCHNIFTANAARAHNDANILCLGSRVISFDTAIQITKVFLTTPFEGGRHLKRIQQLDPSFFGLTIVN